MQGDRKQGVRKQYMANGNLAHAGHSADTYWVDDPVVQLQGFEPLLKQIYRFYPVIHHGAIGKNRQQFTSVLFQANALDTVIHGIANNQLSGIHTGLKAILYGFKFQRPNGSFVLTRTSRHCAIQLHEATGFIISAAITYQLVGQSQFRRRMLRPLAEIRQGIRRAISWMYPNYQAQFFIDKNSSKCLLQDALVYSLCGEMFDSLRMRKVGRQFLKIAILSQYKDGAFLEKSSEPGVKKTIHAGIHKDIASVDSQAASLLSLMYIMIFVKTSPNVTAILKSIAYGVERLKSQLMVESHLNNTERLSNRRKLPSRGMGQHDLAQKCNLYSNGIIKTIGVAKTIGIIKTLLLYAHMTDDTESRLLARRITQLLIR